MKLALLYLFAASAWAQQSLAPVAVTGPPAPTGWSFPWWGWPVAGVVVAVALFLALRKWWPAAAAKVQASASTDAAALGKVIADALAHAKANPPAAVVAEPAPAAAAGKQGVPGVFTATVTGDPKVDLPALTAAYLG